MIGKDLTVSTMQVVPLHLQSEDYCHPLQVKSEVVLPMYLQLPRSIHINLTWLYQNTTQDNTELSQ